MLLCNKTKERCTNEKFQSKNKKKKKGLLILKENELKEKKMRENVGRPKGFS